MVDYEVVRHGSLTFYLTEKKIIVKYTGNQKFFLAYNKIRQLRLMQERIRKRKKIKNLNELAELCREHELRWVYTEIHLP